MNRRIIYISIVIVMVVVVFLAAQIAKRNRPEHTATETNHETISVIVASVAEHEFQNEIMAVGTLKARETVLLSPKVSGNVEAVLVDIGDWVKTGEVVVRLDRTNFELVVKQTQAAFSAAEATIQQAEAQFEQAEKEYRRASELLTEKVIPQSRFEAAEAAYKTTLETLALTKEQRNQAKAALETVQEHLKDADIRSPMAGIVVDRNIEMGQSIGPGALILQIVDQSSLKVDIDLPEIDFDRVAVRTPVVTTVDALSGQEFPGKVAVVNPMVKRETRTFRVRIEVPNPTGKLVDGMFARVKLSIEKRITLSIPRDALQRLPGSGTFYVFVVEENKVLKRTIKVGAIGDQYAEVLDGLAEGEKVVTSGTGRLRSGTKVMVFQEKTNELKPTVEEKRHPTSSKHTWCRKP